MSEPTLPRIDMAKRSFEANGHTYYIQSQLSLSRYVKYLQLSNKLAFGVEFQQIYQTLVKIEQAIGHGNDLLDAMHKVKELTWNQLYAIKDFGERKELDVLHFCALFINREDEDLGVFDERIVEQKIHDWTKEGLAIDDFFLLAGGFIPSFRSALKEQSPKSGSIGTAKKKTPNPSPHSDSTTKTSRGSSLAREANRTSQRPKTS